MHTAARAARQHAGAPHANERGEGGQLAGESPESALQRILGVAHELCIAFVVIAAGLPKLAPVFALVAIFIAAQPFLPRGTGWWLWGADGVAPSRAVCSCDLMASGAHVALVRSIAAFPASFAGLLLALLCHAHAAGWCRVDELW